MSLFFITEEMKKCQKTPPHKPRYCIVKVQLSLNPPPRRMLVYSEDHQVFSEREVDQSMVDYVKNQAKSFWKAKVSPDKIELLKQVSIREW